MRKEKKLKKTNSMKLKSDQFITLKGKVKINYFLFNICII